MGSRRPRRSTPHRARVDEVGPLARQAAEQVAAARTRLGAAQAVKALGALAGPARRGELGPLPPGFTERLERASLVLDSASEVKGLNGPGELPTRLLAGLRDDLVQVAAGWHTALTTAAVERKELQTVPTLELERLIQGLRDLLDTASYAPGVDLLVLPLRRHERGEGEEGERRA